MAMKSGTKLQPRHSKALEGPSAKTLHFTMSPTLYQTTPTKAESALRKAIVRRAGGAGKPRKKKVPTPAKWKPGGKTTHVPKNLKANVHRNCNEITECVECITQRCSFVSNEDKLGCVDPKLEHWGVDEAKSKQHCNFFIQLSKVTAENKARVNQIAMHILEGSDEATLMGGKAIPGGHMDDRFRDKMNSLMASKKMKFRERDYTTLATDGIVIYKDVEYEWAEGQWYTKHTHTTWRSDMYKFYHVEQMCQIAAHWVKKKGEGSVAVPNSYNGRPICLKIVSRYSPRVETVIGSCYPTGVALRDNTWAGTSCLNL